MIEELEGKHLLAFAEIIDRGDPEEIASECVEFSVTCATGVASVFNSAARKRLREGKPLNSAKYDPHVVQADLVNHLLDDSGPGAVRSAMAAMEQMQGFRLIRREAWQGVLGALRLAEVTPGLTVRDAVVKMRNQLRVTGRHPESRIVARPLLIKGLEFDHAVVVDAHTYNAHELYVCLTRGSKSLTVVSARSALSPRRPG
jgi:hypothetical protein